MEFRKAIMVGIVGSSIGLAPVAFAAAADKDSQTATEYLSDAAITTKVKTAIMADKALSSLDISVETNDGVTMLSGAVATSEEVERAEAVASDVDGVKQVDNRVTVDPEKKPADAT